MHSNLPTLLTWARVVAIPLLVAVFFLPLPHAVQNLIATVLFTGAAITDWLDGWLARRWGQTSAFGAFLDPVADKLIVCVALVMLVDLGRVDAIVAAIIVGRELTISALREWMAQMGARASVAVHSIGKLKTVAQLVAIPLLLFDGRLFGVLHTRPIGTWLVWIAAVLTVWSMLYYLRQAWPVLRDGANHARGRASREP
ncbi:CDP-diacylglycerol--glycerol-3-phosphate 3-phosphatidyltransferase [Burkholderiaceae bacterium FT117]|uniref:CDP-diacylglycerol--glycerol-3-phosphate 3-phosphatidyltransferase n=1 Tax=Zeimonas sediminis TaxID=2944268 RepID=UPI002342C790|nr:CDP-diacylglycerol--glycerol-3-phosphate 3-phosphatidyltransferase [Zeimonas sediminis]MCM5569023.1 CDP-diacylglycerol--glycerol-3-phosphate 3-phosphatidyltransferase [Zeimonas sediminis]